MATVGEDSKVAPASGKSKEEAAPVSTASGADMLRKTSHKADVFKHFRWTVVNVSNS